MKEKLQVYALIAEIIGGIAIFISLIFVGIEMRRNTNAEYAASFDRLLSDRMEWRLSLANNSDLLESMNEATGDRTTMTTTKLGWETYIQLVERAYYSYSRDALGEEEWEAFKLDICIAKGLLGRGAVSQSAFSRRFIDYLESSPCEQPFK